MVRLEGQVVTRRVGAKMLTAPISKYHNRNPYSLAHLSDPKGANMSLPPFLETVNQVLLGLSLIPAIALLIGAVFDPQGVRHCTNHSMGNILGMFDNL